MLKAVMILLALAAIRVLPRALRSEARMLELTALLFTTATTMIVNTSKTVATEQRTAALEVKTAATNTAVAAIQTQLTGNTGFANANGWGPTSTANPAGVPTGAPNDTGFFNTGGASAGTAHFHALPKFPTATHGHDFDGHTHDFGGHNHPL